MIHDASALPLPLELEADLCVVGSGAGGSMAAMIAAEAGLRVVVLEAGGFVDPGSMNQREDRMLSLLYEEGGARASVDRAIRIHQGRGIGGSTLHNLNLCKRIPNEILELWHSRMGLAGLSPETWQALYDEVEALLAVSDVPESDWNLHNRLLQRGATSLGWRGGGLRHNRTGCVGSGFCELGCAFDAKNNALKVLMPRVVRGGADVLCHARAIRVTHESGAVTGVEAEALGGVHSRGRGPIVVRAPRVCLSASATGSAAIWLRSGLDAAPGSVGDSLRIHPAVVAAGVYDAEVRAWSGIPQTYECTELLDFSLEGGARPADRATRIWIMAVFGHPAGTATTLPGHGEAHASLMTNYGRLGVFAAMLHDETRGRVRPRGDTGLDIAYELIPSDRRELAFGLEACARLHFAAGAREVLVPTAALTRVASLDGCSVLRDLSIAPGSIDVTAVHPMGSIPMGPGAEASAVDDSGRAHRVRGLWVADGSLFPTSIGGPPQLSIYAMGLRVGRAIVAAG